MPLLRNLVFSATVSVDHAGEVCTPTSLVPDTRQVIVENVKLNLNFTYQPFTPIRGDPNFDSSHHLVLIILWYAFWVVVAYFLHIFAGRYFSQPRNGSESRSQSCLYRNLIERSHAGLGGPSILEEGSPPLSSANASDDDPANVLNPSNGRGRQPAAIGNNDILPCSNPLAGQVGTQNCLSINENDAPTANSYGSSISPIQSNLVASTSLLPRDSVSTPHSGVQCPIIQERRAHLSRPISSQSNQQLYQDATLDASRSFPTETTPLLTAHLPQPGPPPSPITNPNAVEPESTDSEETGPLFATLFPIGSLVVDLPTKWFILVVAVTCKEYKVIDPKFDLDFLQKVFGQSKSKRVRLEWLAEGDATLKNIQAKLISLYDEAQETREPFRLCLYLTGIGDGNSKMCLFGGEVVSEQELGSWTLDLHDRATGSQRSNPISVIFDFCRETMEQRDLTDGKLGVVWSSSVGEPPSANAHPLGDGLPMSCFLIALFSVANDYTPGSNTFGEALRLELKQLGDFLRFCYDGHHEVNSRCKPCKTKGERCPRPATQVPEWDSAGLDMITALAELIKIEFSEHAREVSEALARKMERRGFLARNNGSHLSPDSNRAS